MPCVSRTFDFIFFLRGYGQTHTNKKCLHGLCPAYIFCGGQKDAGHACCSCSPYTSQAPPANPRTPARAR
jgi:hypothetical protein